MNERSGGRIVRWGRDGLAWVDGCLCSRWGPPVDEMRRRKYQAQIEGAQAWLETWGATASHTEVARVIARAEEAQAMLHLLDGEG